MRLRYGRPGFDPWVGKLPWRREWLPSPVFWPGEFHGLYSQWGFRESDTTERLWLHQRAEVQGSHLTWNWRTDRHQEKMGYKHLYTWDREHEYWWEEFSFKMFSELLKSDCGLARDYRTLRAADTWELTSTHGTSPQTSLDYLQSRG